ncbi:alpha/beta fold hydrolase [Paenibacillus silviterrae]|uniref:alpha/beta fold hydrolase n=1 Tax=Paenibacillus silviterrae TaxID=3242194 RepID=UPI0025434B36|nr:alpha/beta hydrolase [Paenibacillus chinjuensis]
MDILMNPNQLEHTFLDVNGVRLHIVQAGPEEGPLFILLHGFPECWFGWRYQLPYLAGKGYRVWAIDQRGYNESEKPKELGSYRLNELAQDVVECIRASGKSKAIVAGHDWGGIVAWHVAAVAPELLDRLIILNAPEPSVMIRHLLTHPNQMAKSLYILFFQLPWLPECLARWKNWSLLKTMMQKSSRKGTFTAGDLKSYQEAWSEPGAYRSMLNWYRALVRRSLPSIRERKNIHVPTLILWGIYDSFLDPVLAKLSKERCENGQLVYLEATHWVQHEQYDQVNERMDRFIRTDSH